VWRHFMKPADVQVSLSGTIFIIYCVVRVHISANVWYRMVLEREGGKPKQSRSKSTKSGCPKMNINNCFLFMTKFETPLYQSRTYTLYRNSWGNDIHFTDFTRLLTLFFPTAETYNNCYVFEASANFYTVIWTHF